MNTNNMNEVADAIKVHRITKELIDEEYNYRVGDYAASIVEHANGLTPCDTTVIDSLIEALGAEFALQYHDQKDMEHPLDVFLAH